jgi:hypothetical protein
MMGLLPTQRPESVIVIVLGMSRFLRNEGEMAKPHYSPKPRFFDPNAARTGLAAPLVTEWNGNLPAGPRNFVESIGGAVFDPGADTAVLGDPLAGAAGTARGLFFHDADGNGAYTPGEDFWADAPGGQDGVFDAGLDALTAFFSAADDDAVWDGVSKGAAPAALADVAAGALGTAANVFYLDRNGDHVRNPGEDLVLAGRNGAADVPVRFYQPGVDGFLHSGRWPAAVGPGQAPPADAVGTPGQVHLHDADGDGRWSAGEDVWVDLDRNGVFDPAVDPVLWDGGDEVVQLAAGYVAPVSDVVFTDLDGSGDWNPGEPVSRLRPGLPALRRDEGVLDGRRCCLLQCGSRPRATTESVADQEKSPPAWAMAVAGRSSFPRLPRSIAARGRLPLLGAQCAGQFRVNWPRSARPTARGKPVSHGGTEARRKRDPAELGFSSPCLRVSVRKSILPATGH